MFSKLKRNIFFFQSVPPWHLCRWADGKIRSVFAQRDKERKQTQTVSNVVASLTQKYCYSFSIFLYQIYCYSDTLLHHCQKLFCIRIPDVVYRVGGSRVRGKLIQFITNYGKVSFQLRQSLNTMALWIQMEHLLFCGWAKMRMRRWCDKYDDDSDTMRFSFKNTIIGSTGMIGTDF